MTVMVFYCHFHKYWAQSPSHNCFSWPWMILISQHNLPGTGWEWWCLLWCFCDALFHAVLHWHSTQHSQVFGEIICIIIQFQGPVQFAVCSTVQSDLIDRCTKNYILDLLHIHLKTTTTNHHIVTWSSNRQPVL